MIKKFIHLLNCAFFFLCFSVIIKAQTANQTAMAVNGAIVNVNSDETWNNEIKFGDNSTLNIKSGVLLTFGGNLNDTGKTVTINIEDGAKLKLAQVVNFNGNYSFNISKNASLVSGDSPNFSNLTISNGNISIENYGNIFASVLDLLGDSQKVINNYNEGVINVNSNINIGGETKFRNFGSIYVGARYNNSAKSLYINCGVIYSKEGFNLGGGKIINTNLMLTNGVDFGNSSSELKNYGVLWALGNLNVNSNYIRNAGVTYFQGLTANGTYITGADPTDNITSHGVIYVPNNSSNRIKGNNFVVGPNLDFTTTDFTSYESVIRNITNAETLKSAYGQLYVIAPRPSEILQSSDVFDSNTVKYSNENPANSMVTFNARAKESLVIPTANCPNSDGIFIPIVTLEVIALNDSYKLKPGSSSEATVLINDTHDGGAVTLDNVIFSVIEPSHPDVTIDPTSGKVTVKNGTPAGTYTINYTICSKVSSTACSTATVTVTVESVPTSSVINEIVSLCEPYVAETNPVNATTTIGFDSVPQIESKVNDINYGKGIGKQLTSFKTATAGTRTIQRIGIPKSRFYIRRNNDPAQKARDILFIESAASGSNDLLLTYPTDVEQFFSLGYINAGIDNVFNNSGGANASNAERLDVVFEEGYKVIDPKNELILVIERGRNDKINIAVIKSINADNLPTALGQVNTVETSKMYNLLNGNMNYKIIKRENPTDFYVHSQNASQVLGLSVISYSDLGIAAGETIYGYVLLPSDIGTINPLEFEKFPTNTTETNGGHDLGVVYGVFTACETYACYNGANTVDAGMPVNHGITLLQRAGEEKKGENWPMVRQSGFTVIESNSNGFVPTRMAKSDFGNISNPQEGMMVFDTTDQCLKIYDGSSWNCFSTPACP